MSTRSSRASPVRTTPLRRPQSTLGQRPPPAPMFKVPSTPSMTGSPRTRPASSMSYRPQTPGGVKDVYKGTITVSIRPKPDHESYWDIKDNQISNEDLGQFEFDNVFQVSDSNRVIYEKCASSIIDNVLKGFNGCIFAYGMTGSGKTYSMTGNSRENGLLQYAINELFNKKRLMATTSRISLSYLEIYNERIIDLLDAKNLNKDLKIIDDFKYGNKVLGLSEEPVNNVDELISLISNGDLQRKIGETEYNLKSSRSHAIVMIKVNTVDPLTKLETYTSLSLCDLAGSERAVNSQERRKEGAYINKSLLALSTVINKLSLNNNTGHIPYRDSKLTRLLQPSLSGNSIISILCTIHLGHQQISETSNTLRFAARAKNVVLNVNKKEFGDEKKIIQNLNNVIERQRKEIEMLKSGNGGDIAMNDVFLDNNSGVNSDYERLRNENKLLYEKIDHLNRLTELQKAEEVILRNDLLNSLVKVNDFTGSQQVMKNLEEIFQKQTYEVEQHKHYISRLEQEVRNSKGHNTHNNDNTVQLNNMLKEQNEEIQSLKEKLTDKDRMIRGLKSTQRLANRLVDLSNINGKIGDLRILDQENIKPM